MLLDLGLITTCYYAAYRIRFEGPELAAFLPSFSASLPAILGCQLAALYGSGLYSRIWSTFGLHDLSTVIRAVGSGLVLSVLAVTYLYKFDRFSRSVFLIDAVLLVAVIVATRMSFRVFGRIAARTGTRQRRVAVYGAGSHGQMLVREMLADSSWGRNPVAFIDDDQGKQRQRMMGVPVRATLDGLDALIGDLALDELLISTGAIDAAREARARAICGARKVAVRRLFFDIR